MGALGVDEATGCWIVDTVRGGATPDAVIAGMLARGWAEQAAIDAIETVMRDFLDRHAEQNSLPESRRVPSPIALNGSSFVDAGDRVVRVLANLMHPRVIIFGDVLSEDECDALVDASRDRVKRSFTFNLDTGEDQEHPSRTSEGTFFRRGETELCARIETRLQALLQWPLENGEGLQILRYGPGAEYQPHYDYFDPAGAGANVALHRGGQRVASLVMYLNTPLRGGATVFPDARFEVAAVKGNAVFFSYDRPHPMTASLHGGAPVIDGEKWIATKWLRENRHD